MIPLTYYFTEDQGGVWTQDLKDSNINFCPTHLILWSKAVKNAANTGSESACMKQMSAQVEDEKLGQPRSFHITVVFSSKYV